MRTAEPTLEALANPLLRYFLATRPPFLAASLVPALIGIATAAYAGVAVNVWTALLTVLGAVLAHAGVNVLNDYYDALNGTDAVNEDRLYPFTGGSRFIQNGVLSLEQTRVFGWALLTTTAVIGIWLALQSGPALWLIGLAGILIGWAYSAPPLSLNSRGLGELSVALGFGILVPLGADYVQSGHLGWLPVIAGAPYALLIANLLYINQFPDRRADEQAGKHHWVVRLGARRARWGYLLLLSAAQLILTSAVAAGLLPPLALLALLAVAPGLMAARELLCHAEEVRLLAPAIQRTILTALAHGLLLSAALTLAN